MLKAFIFDMDGVIIDSEPLHFLSDKMVMKDFGIEVSDEELNAFVGVTNPLMWQELRIKYDLAASVEELLLIQHKYKTELFSAGELNSINGIPELLKELKEREIKVGLASSSSRQFIELVLKKLDLFHYFDVVISGEEVLNSKPAPDIFLEAAAALEVNPLDCVVLEDSGHGVTAAKAAGMKCIAFRNPNSGNQKLDAADCIVCTLEKLDFLNIN